MARFGVFLMVVGLLGGCHGRAVRSLPQPNTATVSIVTKAGTGWAHVAWKAAPGVTSYTVYRAEGPKGPWRLRAETKGTAYTDRKVLAGKTYFYAVRTKVAGKLGPFSRMARATPVKLKPVRAPAGPPLAIPENVSATLLPDGAIEINWSDSVTNETGYRISRRIAGGTKSSVIAKLPAGATRYIDRAAGPGEVWDYRVYAASGARTSRYSEPALAAVPLPAPKGLVAHTLSESTVRLSWKPQSKLHTGYRVERRTGKQAWRIAAMLPAAARSYDNRMLRPRTRYTYRIVAIGRTGDSPLSNETSAVTRPLPKIGSSMKVAGGCFDMGGTSAEHRDARAHRVCLRPFHIDVYEVTNAQYLACLRAGACTSPHEWSVTRRKAYFMTAKFASHPVVNVTWPQAQAYCSWKGKRLPTEAEWEFAARGAPRGAKEAPAAHDCRLANIRGDEGCAGHTVRVASYPPNRAGLYDMIGNVWEWTADYYDERYYHFSPVTAPTGPAIGERRVRRGGSFMSENGTAKPENRAVASNAANGTTGFRCARDGVLPVTLTASRAGE